MDLLIVNFDDELHHRLKVQATKDKITLRDAVAQAIKDWVRKQK